MRLMLVDGTDEADALAKLDEVNRRLQADGLEPDGPPERMTPICGAGVRLAQVYRPPCLTRPCRRYVVKIPEQTIALDAVDAQDAGLQARAELAWRCGHNEVDMTIEEQADGSTG